MTILVRLVGAITLALGIILYLTPTRIFPVCGFPLEPGAEVGLLAAMACYKTLRVAQALAAVAVIVGLIPALWAKPRVGLFSSIATVGLGILVILTPLVIAPVCRFPNMSCRLGTRPALITLGLLLTAAGGIGTWLLRKAHAQSAGP